MSHPFDSAVEGILSKGTPFKKQAYYFLNEALGKAMKAAATKSTPAKAQHVNARTLSFAFRDLALDQYGGLAKQVLNHWGLYNSQDIGNMVYQLVEDGIWSKTEEDSLEDFNNLIDFDEAFIKPFAPIPVQDSPEAPKKKRSKALSKKNQASTATKPIKTRKQPAPKATPKRATQAKTPPPPAPKKKPSAKPSIARKKPKP